MSTFSKAQRKTTPLGSPSISTLRVNTEMAASAQLPTLQSIQASLELIQEFMARSQESSVVTQETMKKNQEETNKNFDRMAGKIEGLEARMEGVQETITKHEQKIQDIETNTLKIENEIGLTEGRLRAANKDLEGAIAVLEMEKSAYYLRFQNVPEQPDEDLRSEMAKILSDNLQIEEKEIRNHIDEVYRIQTNFAKKNKVPREVHLRFTKKSVRDEIYRCSRNEQIMCDDKEIITLKQIPKRIRDRRRDFHFLTAKLIRQEIPFRWLIPEGLLITWRGKKVKIDSFEKADNFIAQHLEGEDTTTTPGTSQTRPEEREERLPEDAKERNNRPRKEERVITRATARKQQLR